MGRLVAFILTTVILRTCSALGGSQLLSANIGYWMTWSYTNTSLTITLTANTTGFLALGFSHGGGMSGADIVTVTAMGGAISIQDRHGVGTFLPTLDAKQDYTLLNSNLSNGQMKATFSRALDTCDPDDMQIKPYTMQVIYAYGSVDASGTPQYHGSNRGTISMYIMNTVPVLPSDSGIFNIDPIPQKITISNSSVTTYWCSIVQFPNVANKSHIIQMQPMITPGNEDIVHHIVVYSCSSVNLNFTSFDIMSGMDGGNIGTCTSVIAVWAVGGETYTYPANAGLPIGGGNSPTYILIQTHYNNVMLVSGRIDSSYIRFKATRNLRQYDAGILQTGIVAGIFVPPNVTQMLVSGYCTSNCLSATNVPASGINIFSVVLHAHLLGRGITLRSIRSLPSPQITVIADDPFYDFDYQEIWNLDKYFQVLPGDILQTVCNMSSANRYVATQGGLGTYQEMCVSFVFYFPKIGVRICQTSPPFAFDASDPMYQQLGKNISSFSWYDSYSNDGLAGATWSTQLTQTIQAEYFNGTNGEFCMADSITTGLVTLPTLASSPLPNAKAISQACDQKTSVITSLSGGNRPVAAQLRHYVMLVIIILAYY